MRETKWQRCRRWFHDSETIAYARIQVFLGVLVEVLVSTDLSPFIAGNREARMLATYTIVNGVAHELLRRCREPHFRADGQPPDEEPHV